jgi:hypothetical protein
VVGDYCRLKTAKVAVAAIMFSPSALTASDKEGVYTGWGGPPERARVDGTVVPAAVAGSLAFEPRLCLDALEEMRARYGQRAWAKYGFVDAFNPSDNWFDTDVIGIDLGGQQIR